MGKKNRNRGSGRGRYDDMFDYASGNDEDYQYSYQDEIDSTEFIDVEDQKDSRNGGGMSSTEKKTKSQAAEERESWDFIKAKMDQSLSKLGSSSASGKKNDKADASSKEEKEKKPKGPNPAVVLFGKMKSFFSAAFQKTCAVFKRKPKPEEKISDASKDPAEKKPGVARKTFSFLKKKTETFTDAVKAAAQKKKESKNSSGEQTNSKDAKPTPDALMRERRKTYLILGTITMCIVLLLLTAGILFIVNHSGKSGKPVAQNTGTQTAAQTQNSTKAEQSDELSLPLTANSASNSGKTQETVPPSLDSDLGLPDPLDDLANNSATKSNEKSESEIPTVDDLATDLTVGDVVKSNETSKENATDPLASLDSLVDEIEVTPSDDNPPTEDPLKALAKPEEKEEKAEDPLAGLSSLPELETSEDASGKTPDPSDLSELPSLTDSTPEEEPLKANDSANTSLQEETPSLNDSATKESEGKDSASDSSPSLLDLPESDSPGPVSVSPTISRSENQNQLPEEMRTPDGVNPGSNVESWNTPESTDLTDSTSPKDSLDLNDTPSGKETELDGLGLDENVGKKESKASETEGVLGDLNQLDASTPTTPPSLSLDTDLGSGNDLSPSTGTSKDQKNTKYTNYTSLKDDTFWKISEKFYQTPAYEKALSRYNIDVVPDPNNLKEGTVLQIPDVNFLRSCYPTLCPQPPQVLQVPASPNSDQTRDVQYYCAAEGDTLSLIAERLLGDSSRWPEIYRLNADKVRDMDLVPAGVKLLIPADDAIPEQSIWQ